MRKTVLLLASSALVVLLAAGVALAAVVNCVAGADECVGTNNPDTLNGSEVGDSMEGRSGDDRLYGNAGSDDFDGGRHEDTIRGGEGEDFVSYDLAGEDKIYGDGGQDFLVDDSQRCAPSGDCVGDRNLLVGGEGGDYLQGHSRLYGGPGNDEIYGVYFYGGSRVMSGGTGTDVISSQGRVADTIYAQDGERDEISCGPKTDKVYYDAGIDSVDSGNCERRIAQPPR
jgi:Ca2+-binding RTX toxin-like protein